MRETTVPASVIGGVTLEKINQVAAAGAGRIAVSQAVCRASDPRRTAQELLRAIR